MQRYCGNIFTPHVGKLSSCSSWVIYSNSIFTVYKTCCLRGQDAWLGQIVLPALQERSFKQFVIESLLLARRDISFALHKKKNGRYCLASLMYPLYNIDGTAPLNVATPIFTAWKRILGWSCYLSLGRCFIILHLHFSLSFRLAGDSLFFSSLCQSLQVVQRLAQLCLRYGTAHLATGR